MEPRADLKDSRRTVESEKTIEMLMRIQILNLERGHSHIYVFEHQLQIGNTFIY